MVRFRESHRCHFQEKCGPHLAIPHTTLSAKGNDTRLLAAAVFPRKTGSAAVKKLEAGARQTPGGWSA